MPKAVKIAAVAVAGVALTVLFVGIFLPTHYVVERSVVLDVPADRAWPLLGDLRAQEAWSPWAAADASASFTYSIPSSGDGASCTWEGQAGPGALTVARSDPPHRLDFAVDTPDLGHATGWMTLEPSGGGTRVTWTVEGDQTALVVGPWIAATMDGALGPRLEDALARLKPLAESGAAAGATPPAAPVTVATPRPAEPAIEGAGAAPAPQ